MKEVIIMNIFLKASESLHLVTKKVFRDFNKLSEQSFMNKYSISKAKYLKRVIKYGDPYKNAPLAKIGKWLNRLLKRK